MNFEEELPESTSPSPEDRLDSFAELLREAREQKGQWQSQVHSLLDSFARFLEERPSPPQSWRDRLGNQADRYEYHQIVLPNDYTDPYLDELENIRLLQEKFSGNPGFIALENYLVTRNHFLFGNSHLAPIELPRPLAMFESIPDSPEISWDCTLTVFSDGSWQAYNLDRDEEDSIGEDITDHLNRWMPLLSHMRVLIPEEGHDYGVFGPVEQNLEE